MAALKVGGVKGRSHEDGEMRSLVAYRLDSLETHSLTPVLVAGYGNAMKAAVRACGKYLGDKPYVTGTDDKERGFACSGRANVVSIGEKFDKRLFDNAYALMKAAESSGARTILLADPAQSDSGLLRSVCARRQIALLAPMKDDKSLFFWESLDPEEQDGAREPDWRACSHCGMYHDARRLMEEYGRCPSCGKLYRLDSDERIALMLDEGSFVEWDADVDEEDPLQFPDFERYIERARAKGKRESVRTGYATLEGFPVAVGIMEPGFMMGSLGFVAGERLARLFERASRMGLAVIVVASSGGARMQEGTISLMQMAKVSVAVEEHARAGLPYISILCDPTTGGVEASFATQADVILAEPGALIGFAGRRVIEGTIKQELPDGFQTAEFALAHGMIDAIVERKDLRAQLSLLLALHVRMGYAFEGSDQPGADDGSEDGLAPLLSKRVDGEGGRESGHSRIAKRKSGDGGAWDSVKLARNVHRPTARSYIERMVDGFVELHGDRCFGDDAALIGGIGWIGDFAVTVIAQEKGANLRDRIRCNFGCPQPEGYRKAQRLMRQAEKFRRPIVCFVDTQGAFCGVEAEERGQGNAIADSLMELAGLTVPVVSVIVGEGGSGGALAIALANRVAMQENAVYSVLSPEGFASILWKDPKRAPEAAGAMKMGAWDAYRLGVVEAVLDEGDGPAHKNPDAAASSVKDFICDALRDLSQLPGSELRAQRHGRFRSF